MEVEEGFGDVGCLAVASLDADSLVLLSEPLGTGEPARLISSSVSDVSMALPLPLSTGWAAWSREVWSSCVDTLATGVSAIWMGMGVREEKLMPIEYVRCFNK